MPFWVIIMKFSIVYKQGGKQIAETVRKKVIEYEQEISQCTRIEDFSGAPESDVIIAIGGDGSVLRIANLENKPIMLIRYKSFGFFASCNVIEIDSFMENFLKGGTFFTDRKKIEASFNGRRDLAVNEFMIKSLDDSALEFEMEIKGSKAKETMRIYGDGLIIATPSGSTGHALSFGGPILHKDSKCVLLLPIAPIRASLKPMVLPDSTEISIDSKKEILFIADGQRRYRTKRMRIKLSNEKLILVEKREDFYEKIKRTYKVVE